MNWFFHFRNGHRLLDQNVELGAKQNETECAKKTDKITNQKKKETEKRFYHKFEYAK